MLKAGEPFHIGGGEKTWTVWSFLWAVTVGRIEESGQVENEDQGIVTKQFAEELVKLNEENVQAKWMTLEEIAEMQTVPGLIGTVRRLLDDQKC